MDIEEIADITGSEIEEVQAFTERSISIADLVVRLSVTLDTGQDRSI